MTGQKNEAGVLASSTLDVFWSKIRWPNLAT
jgi:hypothetical protein